MDRLSRFRRSKKDQPTAATPSTTSSEDKSSGSRTPSPAAQALAPPPSRPKDKLSRSPFRGLHLRASAKRARESPPASLPHSPSAAVHLHDDHRAHVSSPLSTKHDATKGDGSSQDGRPKIPSFLTLSPQEIQNKFHELIWLERGRVVQGLSNPSPDFRWARVPPAPQIKHLDRYINIQPWANHRVKLQVAEGQMDYINASPITLTTSAPPQVARPPDRYIAMQGPKKTSMDHMWRMVAEQLRSPGVIIMLTETHEGNIEKCYPYFPRTAEEGPIEINEHDEFGDGFRASVRCEAVEETPAGEDIELRKLILQIYKTRSSPATATNGNGVSQSGPAEGGKGGGQAAKEAAATDVEMKSPEKADVVMKSPVLAATEEEALDVVMKSPGGAEPAAAPAATAAAAEEDRQSESTSTEDYEVAEERVVYHFLYKKWPDFGVPSVSDLESFFALMRLSREKNADPANPRIVHCSAGVGRSGTFIALEHLMRELDDGLLENYDAPREATAAAAAAGGEQPPTPSLEQSSSIGTELDEGLGSTSDPLEGEDLIFATVNQLREQRRTMVQAEPQYLFIYQVLRKLWQDKYGVEADEQAEPAAKRLEVDPFVEEK